ncbi:MAG: CARDB domain-containing protein [Thiohalomonadales bacterium]
MADTKRPSLIEVNYPSGTYSNALRIKFICEDAISGCKWIHYSTDEETYTKISMETAKLDGILINTPTTLSYYAEDAAGNVTVVTPAQKLKYDFANTTSEINNVAIEPSDGQITLSWENSNDVSYAGAIIRRSTSDYPTDIGQGTQIFKGGNTDDIFVDAGLENGTTYYYTIFAYDAAVPPNVSLGEQITGIPLDNIAPSVMTIAMATGGNKKVDLSWEWPTDTDVAGVMIRRDVNDYPATIVDGTLVYEGAALATTDTVQNNTKYYYSLFAFDEVPNYSVPINVSATTADTLAPVDVANFYAEARQGKVILHWDLPFGHDIEGLVIRRDTTAFPVDQNAGTEVAVGKAILVDPTKPELALLSPSEDPGVTDGSTYYYSIFAYDVDNNYTAGVHSSAIPKTESLTALFPKDGAIGISPFEKTISATFTGALVDNTATGSLTLQSILGKTIAGSSNIRTGATNANIIEFVISEPQLDLMATYQATIANTLKDDVGGDVLASNKSWSFTTAEGAWGALSVPVIGNIGTIHGNFYAEYGGIGLVVDVNGDGVAAWKQNVSGTSSQVYANFFTNTSGWDPLTAHRVSTGVGGVSAVKVAANVNHNVFIVWVEGNQVWGNYYTPNAGWGVAKLIQDPLPKGSRPAVSMNDSGEVMVIWSHTDPSSLMKNVYAKSFSILEDWTKIPGEKIEFVNDKSPFNLNVVVENDGSALAVWSQDNIDRNNMIEYNVFDAVSGWSKATASNSHPYSSIGDSTIDDGKFSIKLLQDGSGIVHMIRTAAKNSIFSSRFSFDTNNWSESANVGIPYVPDTGISSFNSPPVSAINSAGVVVVAWKQSFTATPKTNWINKYEPLRGWSTYKIAPDDMGRPKAISVDDNGNIFLVSTGSSTAAASVIKINRIKHEAVWRDHFDHKGYVLNPSSANDSDVSYPSIAVDSHGNTTLIWRRNDLVDGDNIRANRYQFRQADLQVTVDSVVQSTPAGTATLTYTMSNTGSLAASNFTIAFWEDLAIPPATGDVATASVTIPTLDAGATVTGTIDITTTLTTGSAYAIIDPDGTVVESNETNNTSAALSW